MWKDGRILRLGMFLLVVGGIECQTWLRPRHPLCVSQFALANRACAHLPIYTVPPPSPPPGPPPAPLPPGPLPPDLVPPGHHHHHHNGHHDDNEDDDENHHHHHNHNNGSHHRHGPYIHGKGHGHRRRRHHKHERRKVQEETPGWTPVEQECCHWLQQVDVDCVCDILVNLPPFLSKPLHEYTVIVDHVCNVTYACPSRIRL